MNRNDGWWGYNYPKNLDKQENSKLLVPRLVTNLFCVADENGAYYLDNVDVGGILILDKKDLWFLCGILNSPVCDFIFRNTSKPFRGDYLSANKQYIASLPVPRASATGKKLVGNQAKALQKLYTERRNKIALLQRRLDASQCVDDHREPEWFWADVKTAAALKVYAPENLSAREKTAWAKREYEDRLAIRLQSIVDTFSTGVSFSVTNTDGEIQFLVDLYPILSAYVDIREGSFVAAQWRQVARKLVITQNFQVKKLVVELLSLKKTNQTALKEQIIEIDADIQDIEQKININENELNAVIYRLYRVTRDELNLIK